MDYGNSTYGEIPFGALESEFEGSLIGAKTAWLSIEPTRQASINVQATREAALTLDPGA